MIKKMGIWIVILFVVSSVSYGAGRYQDINALLVDEYTNPC